MRLRLLLRDFIITSVPGIRVPETNNDPLSDLPNRQSCHPSVS
jgi:hypothetical protein